MHRLLFILVFSLFFIAPLRASESGIIVRTAQVYADANIGSQRLDQLSAGTAVSVFSRKGGWKEVFSEEKAIVGWVRAYQVRERTLAQQQTQVETKADQRGFLSGLASLSRKASRFFSTGGSSTSSGTATIGVRGLSEAQIKSAKPDFEEFETMQQVISNDPRLASFRQAGQLSANEVAHLVSQEKTGTRSTNKKQKEK